MNARQFALGLFPYQFTLVNTNVFMWLCLMPNSYQIVKAQCTHQNNLDLQNHFVSNAIVLVIHGRRIQYVRIQAYMSCSAV